MLMGQRAKDSKDENGELWDSASLQSTSVATLHRLVNESY